MVLKRNTFSPRRVSSEGEEDGEALVGTIDNGFTAQTGRAYVGGLVKAIEFAKKDVILSGLLRQQLSISFTGNDED